MTATSPTAGATGVSPSADLSVTFSEPVNVAGAWFTISCALSGAHTATAGGGPTTFTLNPDVDFALGETCTTTIAGAQVSDQDTDDPPDTMAANFAWSFTTVGAVRRIHEIQGAAHRSPLEGQAVSDVPGIVTALVSNGFFFEDPNPDGDPATSEGLFVFTGSAPPAAVGDAVLVDGLVTEFRPGGAASTNLTQSELVSPVVEVALQRQRPPRPGRHRQGRARAARRGDRQRLDRRRGDERRLRPGRGRARLLRELRVDARPGEQGARGRADERASGRSRSSATPASVPSIQTTRGGLVIRADDFNPERIHLDDRLMPVPLLDVGDRFKSPVVGILDYSFGNFKLDVSEPFVTVSGGLARESARAASARRARRGDVQRREPRPGRRRRRSSPSSPA